VAQIEREKSELPLTLQADLLGISRSSLYYQPRPPSAEEITIKHRIDELYTEYPFYGSRRMVAQLVNDPPCGTGPILVKAHQ
jgi:putative transposase